MIVPLERVIKLLSSVLLELSIEKRPQNNLSPAGSASMVSIFTIREEVGILSTYTSSQLFDVILLKKELTV